MFICSTILHSFIYWFIDKSKIMISTNNHSNLAILSYSLFQLLVKLENDEILNNNLLGLSDSCNKREMIMRLNFMRSKFNFFRRSNFWSWGRNSICSWGRICSLIFDSFDQEVKFSIMRSKFKKALLGILISWSFLRLTIRSWDWNSK